jgi:predicted nucleic acid-binding protein
LEPAAIAADACRDADDLHVLGLAKTGRADYPVTGDDDLLILKRFDAAESSPRGNSGRSCNDNSFTRDG